MGSPGSNQVPGATAVRRQVFAVTTARGRISTQNVYISLPSRSTASRHAVIISSPRDTPPGVRGAESGSAVLVQLARALGTVARERPVIVVSNDGANTAAWRNRSGVVTVVPVTTATGRVYAFQVLIGTQGTGLRVESKAKAEQVRSISVEIGRAHV